MENNLNYLNCTMVRDLQRTEKNGGSNTRLEFQNDPLARFLPIGLDLKAHVDYLKVRINTTVDQIEQVVGYLNQLNEPLINSSVSIRENSYLKYEQCLRNESSTFNVLIGVDQVQCASMQNSSEPVDNEGMRENRTNCSYAMISQSLRESSAEFIATMAKKADISASDTATMTKTDNNICTSQSENLIERTPVLLLCSFTGQYLECIKPSSLFNMIYYIDKKLDSKFLRVDFAFDDVSKKLSIDDIVEAVKNGNFKGARSSKIITSKDKKGYNTTVYLNKRETPAFYRFYNTKATHENLDTVRFEVELKRDLCRKIIKQITHSIDIIKDDINDYSRKYQSIFTSVFSAIVSRFSFIDRSQNENTSRCPLLNFWQDFVLRLNPCEGGYDYSRSYPKPSIIRKKNWLVRQTSKALFQIKKTLGDTDFRLLINAMVDRGCEKMKTSDWVELDGYKQAFEYMGESVNHLRMNAGVDVQAWA